MRIPLQAGRAFTQFDRNESEPVAIVSERLARLLWPGGNAIGQRLRYNPQARTPSPLRTVVGIAGDVQQRQLGGERSHDMYVPYRQSPAANQYLLVKHRLTESDFNRKAEQAMLSIDHEQSVFDFAAYDQRILASIWQLRLSRLLLLVFGVVALCLAATGVYGVMSYMVGQRRQEIGIRMALGASAGDVRTMVVRRGLLWQAQRERWCSAGSWDRSSAAWTATTRRAYWEQSRFCF
jgi:hypothetical protein